VSATTAARLSALLSNPTIAKLERLRMQPRLKRTARGRGEHLSGKGGSSTDFADYRDYAAGDDLRFVDWNAFARLQRPYLKTFRMEEERHLLIIIDASKSMSWEGKLAQAKRIAAAFAIVGVMANERVSVWAPGAVPGDRLLPPVRGRQAMRRVLTAIEGIPDTASGATLDRAVELTLARHTGRGTALVLSDFLGDGDFKAAFNRLNGAGLELLAVQILAPLELDPQLMGDLRLVDSESGAALDVSAAGDALALYHDHRLRWTATLDAWCSGRGGRFLQCSSEDAADSLLFDRMRKLGWLA
jgi:uncharacterized protein (DUF58 family)